MGTKLRYKPGSWYRICDETGFAQRAEDTRKQWNNLIVRTKSFEERNAQDFVRGRRDSQIVPDPRPRSNNVFLGDITTLSQNAHILATAIFLTAPIGLVSGNVVAIMLDDGSNFFDAIVSSGGDFNADFGPDFSNVSTLILAKPLPFQASAGNQVVNTDFVAIQGPALLPVGS